MAEPTTRDRPGSWPEWITRGFPGWLRAWPGAHEWPEFGDWVDRDAMRLEEYREDDMLVVKAEMPGIDPEEDVEITVSDGTLRIRAERKEKREEKDEDKGFYRSEFRYGQFTRSIPLPAGASEEDVEATYSDGILEIRLPIAEEVVASKKVPIKRG